MNSTPLPPVKSEPPAKTEPTISAAAAAAKGAASGKSEPTMAGGKGAPSAKKSAPPPAPPAKKKRGWFWFKFWLWLAVFASASAVLLAPGQVERFSGVKMPGMFFAASEKLVPLVRRAVGLEKSAAAETAETAEAETTPSAKTKPSAKTSAAVNTVTVTVTQPAADAPQVIRTVTVTEIGAQQTSPAGLSPADKSRILQAEQAAADAREIAMAAAEAAKQAAARAEAARVVGGGGDTRALRLQVVGLQLQLDGDSRAAAVALRKLAAASNNEKENAELLKEATRLQTIPPRSELLAVLRGADAAGAGGEEENAAATAEESAAGGEVENAETKTTGETMKTRLFNMFNIRRVENGGEENPLAARLEFLLLTGQDTAYWQLLQKEAEAPNASAKLKALQRLGAPDYRLRLPASASAAAAAAQ